MYKQNLIESFEKLGRWKKMYPTVKRDLENLISKLKKNVEVYNKKLAFDAYYLGMDLIDARMVIKLTPYQNEAYVDFMNWASKVALEKIVEVPYGNL